MSPEASWLTWLENTPPAVAMREWIWLYPIVEIGHILGFVLLVGSAALFDLRLLGLSVRLPIRDMERYLLPWARFSLLLVVPTGVLLFITDATGLLLNPAFQTKIVLLGLAATNAALYHLFIASTAWSADGSASAGSRAIAVVSLLLWMGIISCGRLIAYV